MFAEHIKVYPREVRCLNCDTQIPYWDNNRFVTSRVLMRFVREHWGCKMPIAVCAISLDVESALDAIEIDF